MTATRIPGANGHGGGIATHTAGPAPTRTRAAPGSVCEDELTPHEQEVLADLTQLTLDLVGIVEPTPFADTTNAIISVVRGDWLGAGLSGLGIVPYIGDLAKAGKLPKYIQSIHDAIHLARRRERFANAVRPALTRLYDLLNSIPLGRLSENLRTMVDSLKKPLDGFLGRSRVARHIDELEALTDRLLIARLGSTLYVGESVRSNVKKVATFLRKYDMSEDRMLEVLSGIDLHSPLTVTKLEKGDRLVQAVDPKHGIGSWFVKAGGGTGSESSGIASGFRQNKHFEVLQPVEVLQSRAAHVVDTWTSGGVTKKLGAGTVRKPGTRVALDPKTGQIVIDPTTKTARASTRDRKYGVTAPGGGQQFFLPPKTRGPDPGTHLDNRNRWQIYMKELVVR